MDLEYIKTRVEKIERMQGDDEAAHSEEDGLRGRFINWLSVSQDVPKEIQDMAALIMSTDDLDFARWCT